MGYVNLLNKTDNVKFLRALRGSIGGNTTDLATGVFNATVPTAPLFSKAIAQVVDYFLEEKNTQAKEEITKIFLTGGEGASAKIMGYIREALRLNPIVSPGFLNGKMDDADTSLHSLLEYIAGQARMSLSQARR